MTFILQNVAIRTPEGSLFLAGTEVAVAAGVARAFVPGVAIPGEGNGSYFAEDANVILAEEHLFLRQENATGPPNGTRRGAVRSSELECDSTCGSTAVR